MEPIICPPTSPLYGLESPDEFYLVQKTLTRRTTFSSIREAIIYYKSKGMTNKW